MKAAYTRGSLLRAVRAAALDAHHVCGSSLSAKRTSQAGSGRVSCCLEHPAEPISTRCIAPRRDADCLPLVAPGGTADPRGGDLGVGHQHPQQHQRARTPVNREKKGWGGGGGGCNVVARSLSLLISRAREPQRSIRCDPCRRGAVVRLGRYKT